jgi:hypothetical protein
MNPVSSVSGEVRNIHTRLLIGPLSPERSKCSVPVESLRSWMEGLPYGSLIRRPKETQSIDSLYCIRIICGNSRGIALTHMNINFTAFILCLPDHTYWTSYKRRRV